jgi:ribosome-associated toxin RatA of RatAB toxin-antitoxin module
VHRTATTVTSADAADLFGIVADLATYPKWMDLVTRTEPAEPHPGDGGAAWLITLRARVGPFARSKRLRMVRTVHEPAQRVRFERHEVDGRHHSSWILDTTVGEAPGGSEVTMSLRYDGSMWSGLLEAVLGSQIDTAIPRLQDHVEA